LELQKCVTIESIASDDRERMAKSLGGAAVVAALSEYEAHPVAVMEALTLGIPVVGLDAAGMGDLVEDGLVRGVPKDASSTTIARVLVAALEERRRARGAVMLPTWDTAAASLADVYLNAVGPRPRPLGS